MLQTKSKSAKNTLNFFYDKEADVLYVSKGKPSAYDISSETNDEIVVRRDPKTKEVKGFTILNFSQRSSKPDLTVNLPFNIAIQ